MGQLGQMFVGARRLCLAELAGGGEVTTELVLSCPPLKSESVASSSCSSCALPRTLSPTQSVTGQGQHITH